MGEVFKVRMIGFEGGVVGNHAQLLVENDEVKLLLDPTIGLVARSSFNNLLMGKPIKDNDIMINIGHQSNSIDAFRRKVYAGLRNGKYRPSDLLYYFQSMEEYLKFIDEISPLWDKDISALIRRFPTPGAKALEMNLINQRK